VKTTDLAAEMRAAVAAMERRDINRLVGLGVPEILISHFEMVGVARIRADRSGLYEPDPSFGKWHWISPICVQFADTPESTRPDAFPLIGNLVDLVAWHERSPEKWLLRTGAASWMGAIEPQYLDSKPVRIWRSPLSWLRSGCAGLVPLARERSEIYRLLANCSGGLIAEDREHRDQLTAILQYPRPRPPVHCEDDRRAA
jgi:hypothetical protein